MPKTNRLSTFAAVIGASLVAISTSCMAPLDNPERFGALPDGGLRTPAGCLDVPALLASGSCAGAGCHSSPEPAGGLDLVAPQVATRLVGVRSRSGGMLADPSRPESSVLIQRIAGTGLGPRMPVGAPAFDETTIACVRAWIGGLSGAAPSVGPSGNAPPSTSEPPAATPPAASDPRAAVRIASGAMAPYTDPAGNAWSADTAFEGGATAVFSPPPVIANTTTGELYRAERYGADPQDQPASFRYSLPLAKGAYTVTLKFAENYYDTAGKRVFHVDIAGVRALTDFDIFAAAGGKDTAVDRSFPATLDNDGPLVIEFAPGSAEKPKVSAIEVVPK